jgi:hypothetical protein
MHSSRLRPLCSVILCLVATSVALRSAAGQVMSPLTANELSELKDIPSCIAVAQAGYKHVSKSPLSRCALSIQRSNPITPTSFAVPAGTVVYVSLTDTRQNENVTFNVSATKVTVPDTAAAIVKNIIPGLQTITATQPIEPRTNGGTRTPAFAYQPPTPPPAVQELMNNILARQKEIITSTNAVLHSVQSAAAFMTCLSNYEEPVAKAGEDLTPYKVSPTDEPPPSFSCSQQSMIKRDNFDDRKETAFDIVQRATAQPLRLLDQTDLDAVVKSFYLTCLTSFQNMAQQNDAGRNFCREYSETLSTNEALLDTAITDIQKAQDTLIQNVQTLDYWTKGDGAPETVTFKFTIPRYVNVVVTIAGTEVVSKTSSTIASVTITQTTNHFAVSIGIGFSNLKFNTYTASPVIVNGQPVLDPSGKTTTVVVGNATDFSTIAPEALVSYRLGPLSHFLWQTKYCPNNCSFLISGGIGANLTTKSADFDVGPSFQVGSVLLTPTVHFGRDTRLADGVTVGQMLGSSPPSPLPTTQAMVIKWGFVITYALPIP